MTPRLALQGKFFIQIDYTAIIVSIVDIAAKANFASIVIFDKPFLAQTLKNRKVTRTLILIFEGIIFLLI